RGPGSRYPPAEAACRGWSSRVRERRPPAAAGRFTGAAAPAPLRRRRRHRLRSRAVSEQNGTVVCPGSYDPVTNGHIDIITRTSNVFERVVVGVVNNPVRKAKTLFTAEERKAFIEEATAELPNVEVQFFANLLVEFARDNEAKAIVKGLRAISDFEYEF